MKKTEKGAIYASWEEVSGNLDHKRATGDVEGSLGGDARGESGADGLEVASGNFVHLS